MATGWPFTSMKSTKSAPRIGAPLGEGLDRWPEDALLDARQHVIVHLWRRTHLAHPARRGPLLPGEEAGVIEDMPQNHHVRPVLGLVWGPTV